MTNITKFKQLDDFVIECRKHFRNKSKTKIDELEELVNLFFDFTSSLGKLKKEKDWHYSREEYFLSTILKAFQHVFGIYYLSESGYFDLSLGLKRNFVELTLTCIAIGYDKKCYTDWKNERRNFRDVHVIAKRINESKSVPQLEKGMVSTLLKYWNESSQIHSHQTSIKSVEGTIKAGIVDLGPKVINVEVQDQRINALKFMIYNLISIMLGVFSYGNQMSNKRDELPEALKLISRFNKYTKSFTENPEKTI